MNKDKSIPYTFYIFIAIVLSWMFYAITMAFNVSNSQQIGQWGDAFGALNSLFAGLAFAATVVAITISYKAIQKATENTETQIKVSKIEEIFEIVSFLHYRYHELYFLYRGLKTSNEITDERQPKLREEYEKRLEKYKNSIDVALLEKRIYRLNLLANTYLNGELRLKVLAFEDLLHTLIGVSIYRQLIYEEIYYDKGFPKLEVLTKYLEPLKIELVQNISMGGAYATVEEINEYRTNVFKPGLEIN